MDVFRAGIEAFIGRVRARSPWASGTTHPTHAVGWPAGVLTVLAVLSMAGAGQAQQGPPVTVANPLVQELVEWQEFTGQFAAVETVDIRPRVSGYLESVFFQDGDLVEQDQLLFIIDQDPFEASHAAANARLSQARARLSLADSQLDRARGLLANNNISRATFDERQEELRAASAAVQEAEANLRLADLDLGYTAISAPISGRIGRREVSVGNLVIGGSAGTTTTLTTIVSVDPIRFEFDMSEAFFLRYQRATMAGVLESHRDGGVRVEARLFDEDAWPREGRLDFVDNRVDRTSGTIRMRAEFPNPDGFLIPGQFGILRLPGSPRYAAILLPDEAILNDQDRRVVYTVDDNNIVQQRVVRPGPRELGLRIIRSGLSAEDRVIINGILRARPGAPVTPMDGTVALPDAS